LLLLSNPGSGSRWSGRQPGNEAAPSFALAGTSSEPIEIRADAYGRPLAQDALSEQYSKPSISLDQGESIRFQVVIPTEGDYTVAFDYAAPENVVVTAPEGELRVDGALPMEDARRIVFPVFYRNEGNEFPLDRYGNQITVQPVRMAAWTQAFIRDMNFSHKYPVQVHLSPGEHEFTFTLNRQALALGSIYLQVFLPDISYRQYIDENRHPETSGVLITLEAEWPSYKNDVSIRPIYNRSLDVTPYDTYQLLLNTIGEKGWQLSGSALYYEISVPADGMYCITLRALQNTANNFVVFRRVTINDAVPFDEFNELPFGYSTDWENITLGGETPYQVYLHAGVNVIGIEANTSPYNTAMENIRQSIAEINVLSLEIMHLTGNQVDRYREWEIANYIPDINERLSAIATKLAEDKAALQEINGGLSSDVIMKYQMALDNILLLAEEPNKIPIRMNRLSEGPQSAMQLLGTILGGLKTQPLTLDKVYVHSPDVLPPSAHTSPWLAFSEGIKRFFHSFKPNPYQSIGANEGEVEIWVNRSRQFVDLMQQMADQNFTPQTGIQVKFSIMPAEAKLALAVAAGLEPDVALGVSTDIPYELAVRNALYDLRSFNDFDSFIRIYSPGSLLSYMINDSVYAIPETQDFWVTYYRRDSLDSLGLDVPRTWDEVFGILPELQRYGMNYYTPLSSGAGYKNYLLTAPYLWNLDAELYSPDGMSSGLGSEASIAALQFMAEQFTVYGMPLTAASFFDSFRSGTLPIGISNAATYTQLRLAAPELEGLWGMDLYPATILDDGAQNRYVTGSAQTCMIMADTDMPQESWEFLKWWMSTETQVQFERQLLMNYGPEYLWYTANLEAFRYLPIPEEHKDVILAQWQWLQEPVRLPGAYMQERAISNAWNQIVFGGRNPRVAIDDAILVTNREITRKLEELGYTQNGVPVRPITVPTIETIRQWMDEANR